MSRLSLICDKAIAYIMSEREILVPLLQLRPEALLCCALLLTTSSDCAWEKCILKVLRTMKKSRAELSLLSNHESIHSTGELLTVIPFTRL